MSGAHYPGNVQQVSGGPYGIGALLETWDTVFPHTVRSRLANNVFCLFAFSANGLGKNPDRGKNNT